MSHESSLIYILYIEKMVRCYNDLSLNELSYIVNPTNREQETGGLLMHFRIRFAFNLT